MLQQLIPVKNIALGSHKVFSKRFRPTLDRINLDALKKFILTTTQSAYKVMVIWVALKCSECTDKLCIQYCQKLRKK